MNNLSRFTWKYCFCFISIGFLSSCGGGSADKEVAKTDADSAAKVAPAQMAPVQAAGITSGYLDTLWTDSENFDTLKIRRLVFSFVFGQLDTLTLHGWLETQNPNKQFDTDPNVQLKKGGATQFMYGPGTYFGNEVLAQSDLKHVQIILRSEKALFVLFVPTKIGNNIYYEIFVSKTMPFAPDKKFTTPTGSGTNPSPPKNY